MAKLRLMLMPAQVREPKRPTPWVASEFVTSLKGRRSGNHSRVCFVAVTGTAYLTHAATGSFTPSGWDAFVYTTQGVGRLGSLTLGWAPAALQAATSEMQSISWAHHRRQPITQGSMVPSKLQSEGRFLHAHSFSSFS